MSKLIALLPFALLQQENGTAPYSRTMADNSEEATEKYNALVEAFKPILIACADRRVAEARPGIVEYVTKKYINKEEAGEDIYTADVLIDEEAYGALTALIEEFLGEYATGIEIITTASFLIESCMNTLHGLVKSRVQRTFLEVCAELGVDEERRRAQRKEGLLGLLQALAQTGRSKSNEDESTTDGVAVVESVSAESGTSEQPVGDITEELGAIAEGRDAVTEADLTVKG